MEFVTGKNEARYAQMLDKDLVDCSTRDPLNNKPTRFVMKDFEKNKDRQEKS